jgi:hypothetical protein
VSLSDNVLDLVTNTLDALETNRLALSDVIRRCCRIARLRNDYLSLWWLEYEMIEISDSNRTTALVAEIAPNLTKEEFLRHKAKIVEHWIEERSCCVLHDNGEINNEKQVITTGVGQIEVTISHLQQEVADITVPEGLNPVDLYFRSKGANDLRWKARFSATQLADVLEKIRQRVFSFLSHTEKQLLYGQLHADIFERNRRYVDLKLGQLCPDALEKFIEVYRRLQENTPESRAQALTSCRRLLKSLADSLYPPADRPVIGADGKSRELTDAKYIARLWQYMYEHAPRSKSGELMKTQVQYLGARLDSLYDLACKGVHAEISEFEVNQCAIQTYLLAGDLLRLSEGISAIGMESE